MAASEKESKKQPSGQSPPQANAGAPAPPGDGKWEDAGTPDIDGWYSADVAKEKGEWAVGRPVAWIKLTGRNTNQLRKIVLLRLEHPLTAVSADDTEQQVVLQKGQTVAVDVKAKLNLLPYITHKCPVRFIPEKKVSIGGGQTMWKFKFQAAQGSKQAPPPPAANDQTATGDAPDDDDIPF